MEYVLITGVSTGIGKATTAYLIDRGYFVIGSVRKESHAQALEATFPNNFKALIFDVTNSEQIKAAFDKVQNLIGNNGLSALVNNAGIAVSGPLEHIPMEKIRYQFDVNVFGLMEVTKTFLPLLKTSDQNQRSAGKIVNISSISGIITTPFAGLYCASKFALESFSDALRRELFIHGIDVIVIQPGPIKTPIWEKTLEKASEYADTAYGPIINSLRPRLEQSEKGALPADLVAKRVYDAIHLAKPRTRYMVVKNAFFLKLVSKFLPDRSFDKLILRDLKKWIKK